MQTQECNLGNMIQFQATDTKALESFVIKKGTVWTVLIDNTSGWYSDSTETSLTTDYEFTKDITINIEQVYPLLNSYMFKDSGTTNYVILSAEPTDTIKDTDEILKFTSMSSADEYWNTLTHITLKNIELRVIFDYKTLTTFHHFCMLPTDCPEHIFYLHPVLLG